MRIQVMPTESGLSLSPTMDDLVVSLVAIVGDKLKPDSVGITWIRMLPDNL